MKMHVALLGHVLLILLALGGCLIGTGCTSQEKAAPPAAQVAGPKLDTEYQAVLLTNGQVFFGRLEGLGTAYPVLREVYYVRTVPTSPEGVKPATSTNILVKRGQEWHAPDRMILNANHIVLVEPVTKDSKVSQLIEEVKKK